MGFNVETFIDIGVNIFDYFCFILIIQPVELKNIKKCTEKEVNDSGNTEGEIKEEGELSEDEEKCKGIKPANQYSLGESRFILEETTGMYYDQVTGYYYNLVS